MAELTDIYMKVSSVCLKDDKGVYLDGQMIALDNGTSNGYIRRNGEMSLEKLSGCSGLYEITLPLKFVGAAPNADSLKLEIATIAALDSSINVISSSEVDKGLIAESEGIALEELTKFDGVAMIMIDYVQREKKYYDPNCDYDLC